MSEPRLTLVTLGISDLGRARPFCEALAHKPFVLLDAPGILPLPA
jgi:hypothetical protein